MLNKVEGRLRATLGVLNADIVVRLSTMFKCGTRIIKHFLQESKWKCLFNKYSRKKLVCQISGTINIDDLTYFVLLLTKIKCFYS